MKAASLNRNLHILFLFIIAYSVLTDRMSSELYTWWLGDRDALVAQTAWWCIWIVRFTGSVLADGDPSRARSHSVAAPLALFWSQTSWPLLKGDLLYGQ